MVECLEFAAAGKVKADIEIRPLFRSLADPTCAPCICTGLADGVPRKSVIG
jgi:hypothetical protein